MYMYISMYKSLLKPTGACFICHKIRTYRVASITDGVNRAYSVTERRECYFVLIKDMISGR